MMNLSSSKALDSMKFKINDIKFECNLRLIREFKVTYNKLKEHFGSNTFSVPETKWNYVIEHYFKGTDNNYIIIEDMDDNFDMLVTPDYLNNVLLNMFKEFPNLVTGKNTVLSLLPISDVEWVVTKYSGIMEYQYTLENIADFWHRMTYDDDIISSGTEYHFRVEL